MKRVLIKIQRSPNKAVVAKGTRLVLKKYANKKKPPLRVTYPLRGTVEVAR